MEKGLLLCFSLLCLFYLVPTTSSKNGKEKLPKNEKENPPKDEKGRPPNRPMWVNGDENGQATAHEDAPNDSPAVAMPLTSDSGQDDNPGYPDQTLNSNMDGNANNDEEHQTNQLETDLVPTTSLESGKEKLRDMSVNAFNKDENQMNGKANNDEEHQTSQLETEREEHEQEQEPEKPQEEPQVQEVEWEYPAASMADGDGDKHYEGDENLNEREEQEQEQEPEKPQEKPQVQEVEWEYPAASMADGDGDKHYEGDENLNDLYGQKIDNREEVTDWSSNPLDERTDDEKEFAQEDDGHGEPNHNGNGSENKEKENRYPNDVGIDPEKGDGKANDEEKDEAQKGDGHGKQNNGGNGSENKEKEHGNSNNAGKDPDREHGNQNNDEEKDDEHEGDGHGKQNNGGNSSENKENGNGNSNNAGKEPDREHGKQNNDEEKGDEQEGDGHGKQNNNGNGSENKEKENRDPNDVGIDPEKEDGKANDEEKDDEQEDDGHGKQNNNGNGSENKEKENGNSNNAGKEPDREHGKQNNDEEKDDEQEGDGHGKQNNGGNSSENKEEENGNSNNAGKEPDREHGIPNDDEEKDDEQEGDGHGKQNNNGNGSENKEKENRDPNDVGIDPEKEDGKANDEEKDDEQEDDGHGKQNNNGNGSENKEKENGNSNNAGKEPDREHGKQNNDEEKDDEQEGDGHGKQNNGGNSSENKEEENGNSNNAGKEPDREHGKQNNDEEKDDEQEGDGHGKQNNGGNSSENKEKENGNSNNAGKEPDREHGKPNDDEEKDDEQEGDGHGKQNNGGNSSENKEKENGNSNNAGKDPDREHGKPNNGEKDATQEDDGHGKQNNGGNGSENKENGNGNSNNAGKDPEKELGKPNDDEKDFAQEGDEHGKQNNGGNGSENKENGNPNNAGKDPEKEHGKPNNDEKDATQEGDGHGKQNNGGNGSKKEDEENGKSNETENKEDDEKGKGSWNTCANLDQKKGQNKFYEKLYNRMCNTENTDDGDEEDPKHSQQEHENKKGPKDRFSKSLEKASSDYSADVKDLYTRLKESPNFDLATKHTAKVSERLKALSELPELLQTQFVDLGIEDDPTPASTFSTDTLRDLPVKLFSLYEAKLEKTKARVFRDVFRDFLDGSPWMVDYVLMACDGVKKQDIKSVPEDSILTVSKEEIEEYCDGNREIKNYLLKKLMNSKKPESWVKEDVVKYSSVMTRKDLKKVSADVIVSSVDSLGDLCDDRKTERVVRKKLLEARGGMDAYKNMDPAEIRNDIPCMISNVDFVRVLTPEQIKGNLDILNNLDLSCSKKNILWATLQELDEYSDLSTMEADVLTELGMLIDCVDNIHTIPREKLASYWGTVKEKALNIDSAKQIWQSIKKTDTDKTEPEDFTCETPSKFGNILGGLTVPEVKKIPDSVLAECPPKWNQLSVPEHLKKVFAHKMAAAMDLKLADLCQITDPSQEAIQKIQCSVDDMEQGFTCKLSQKAQSIVCDKCQSTFQTMTLSKEHLEGLVTAGLACEGMTRSDDQMLWYTGMATKNEDGWGDQQSLSLLKKIIEVLKCEDQEQEDETIDSSTIQQIGRLCSNPECQKCFCKVGDEDFPDMMELIGESQQNKNSLEEIQRVTAMALGRMNCDGSQNEVPPEDLTLTLVAGSNTCGLTDFSPYSGDELMEMLPQIEQCCQMTEETIIQFLKELIKKNPNFMTSDDVVDLGGLVIYFYADPDLEAKMTLDKSTRQDVFGGTMERVGDREKCLAKRAKHGLGFEDMQEDKDNRREYTMAYTSDYLMAMRDPGRRKRSQANDISQLNSTNDISQLHSANDISQLHSTNDISQLNSTNDISQLHSTNDNSQLHSTNDNSQLHSANDISQLHSTNDISQLHLTNDISQLHSTNDISQLHSANDISQITTSFNQWHDTTQLNQ
ncbi:hypothetical protein ScPMuIL_003560 [Solemya velum]